MKQSICTGQPGDKNHARGLPVLHVRMCAKVSSWGKLIRAQKKVKAVSKLAAQVWSWQCPHATQKAKNTRVFTQTVSCRGWDRAWTCSQGVRSCGTFQGILSPGDLDFHFRNLNSSNCKLVPLRNKIVGNWDKNRFPQNNHTAFSTFLGGSHFPSFYLQCFSCSPC